MTPAAPGFTDQPEIRAILAPYEEPNPLPDLIHFQGLAASDARRLLHLLPEWQRDQRQNFSPSFQEFIQLADRFPSITFSGYRITPSREDERITLEGLECQNLTRTEAVRDADELGAEEVRTDTRTVRAWWS